MTIARVCGSIENTTVRKFDRGGKSMNMIIKCVFRRHPDNDTGIIRTAYRNYPDTVSETSGHLVELTN